MFNKIDKDIYNKVYTMNGDKQIDVIVSYAKNLKYFENRILERKNTLRFPFINCIACSLLYKEIIELSQDNSVIYISASCCVKNLMYESKKNISADFLDSLKKEKENHSVVVIDTGVYPHIDFCLGKNRIIKFVDLVNNNEYMYDDNGHGTFVAGVLSGNSITSKYSGIDNNCNIIVIKALDSGGETTSVKILQSMQWILDNKDKYNIRIVCMSFGSAVRDVRDPLMRGAEVLWDNNIVVVAAAGNDGPEKATIMSPGASEKIITVGSMFVVEGNYSVAKFSSRGPAFYNYKPDLVLPGVDIMSTSRFENKSFYTLMSGTSVSTPMVAGVASLILNYNNNYTPDQIKYMLINASVRISGDRNSEGFGRLDLSKLRLI